MPATPFNPSSAVIVHSAVPLDSATLGLLQPEDYLLVHSAPVTATNEVLQETNNAGKLVLYVAFNFQLVWTVDADVLALSGLANYHPGVALDSHSLAFANGAAKPFQYPESVGVSGSQGRLIYENPTRTPMAGDLTAIQFQIRQIFNDIGGETGYDPGDPDPDDSLPPDYSTSGIGLVWMRNLHISRGGVVHYYGPIYYARIKGSGIPANLEEFYAIVDTLPETPDENEVAEVYLTLPPGSYFLPGEGEILSQLESGTDASAFTGLNPTWTFSIELYDPATELSSVVQQPQTDPASTTWQEVVDAYPPPDGLQVVAIYSLAAAAWLDEPEV